MARTEFLAHKYRNIGILQQMNTVLKGGKTMEVLMPLGFLVVWIILQAWILPRFGVKT